ncbi:hypothetical protein C8F04DRAFT_1339618 [Mycena alexandri]|uniref:Ribonuclease H1 N-terminal domain-containing protein n=1 Tax=Mycena alexandri TaxID=1745969 RepID=A0AAD6RX61_9AGAR|nr:hypothetical protein C8F04DRAFT_1244512 [Mycena alexandri]KAJ7036115.1 hypothetical protein C8F04DRAFT_1339618 [Mycena alexandri]
MSNQDRVYTVLGGRNPGVLSRPPLLSGAKDAPVMPIIIKSTTTAEANAALGLQPILKNLGLDSVEADPDAFAQSLATSNQISDVFTTAGPFYAVYRGKTQRAIYVRKFKDVEEQIHDNQYAVYHRFEFIKDALVYMVLRGNVPRMRLLGLYPKGTTDKKGSDASTSSQPASHAQASQKSSPMKLVDSYMRDLSGIVGIIYGSTTSAPTYQSYDLGRHTSYYLQAHGYDESAIEEIQKLWAQSDDVEKFVELLTSRGMAATEVRWLWDLIRHDENCSN